MELLQGETLASRIGVASTMSARHAVLLADQILAALEHAHANEIVHRDLKPANLFLVREGAGGASADRVQILDFGIARLVGPTAAERFGPFFPDDDPIAPALESEVTGEHRICGTPEFMAPEQILGGEPDTRSDFYALGIILFRLVSGQLPFRARTRYEAYHRHLHEPPPSLAQRASVPIPFSLAVQRSLAKNVGERYPSASDMREALRASVGLPPVDRPKLFPSEFDIPMVAESEVVAPDLEAFGLHTLSTPTANHAIEPVAPSAPPSSPARPAKRSHFVYGALAAGAVLAAIATYLVLTLAGRDVPASANTGIAGEATPQVESTSSF
jgi:serine/threonine-protein kinase